MTGHGPGHEAGLGPTLFGLFVEVGPGHVDDRGQERIDGVVLTVSLHDGAPGGNVQHLVPRDRLGYRIDALGVVPGLFAAGQCQVGESDGQQ